MAPEIFFNDAVNTFLTLIHGVTVYMTHKHCPGLSQIDLE